MDDSIIDEHMNDEPNEDQTEADAFECPADDADDNCQENNVGSGNDDSDGTAANESASAARNANEPKLMARPKDSVHKCPSDPSNRFSMSAVRSQAQIRSLRFPSTSGTTQSPTTRKCVLTLDGYNYVIGKRYQHKNRLTETTDKHSTKSNRSDRVKEKTKWCWR